MDMELTMNPITITNPLPVFSADLMTLGGAIRAICAGGSALGDDAIRRSAGMTEYSWCRKGDRVLALVRELEGLSV